MWLAEIYEIRVYENAPPGTKATLNEPFERLLRELNNCFAQLDSEVDWIEFDSPLLMFRTTREVPSAATPVEYATLHLMCASNVVRKRGCRRRRRLIASYRRSSPDCASPILDALNKLLAARYAPQSASAAL